MIKKFETIIYIILFGFIGVGGIYLQSSQMDEQPEDPNYTERHDPDYYIENFTATGLDKSGKRRFVIEAERMAHFPDDDTALLDFPHIIEYQDGFAPRHSYSDSGWMSSTGEEIILTNNVRVVIEADSRGPGATLKSKRLRVLLDKTKKNNELF